MKKEEIYVLIDSEEKRLRAVQILEGAGDELHSNTSIKNREIEFLIYATGKWHLMYQHNGGAKITLDQLEAMLMPKREMQPVKGESYFYLGDESKFFKPNKEYKCLCDDRLISETGNYRYFSDEFFSEHFRKVEKSTPELTFPREMIVWDNDKTEAEKLIVDGVFKGKYMVESMVDVGFFHGYLNAEDLPTFESEVQKLAESFGVKVKNLEYE